MELLDLYFKNNTVDALYVEAFNSFNSFTQVRQQNFNNPNTNYEPFPVWATPTGLTPTHINEVAFTSGGNVVITRSNGALLGSIEAIQYPYRSILNALNGGYKILIQRIRMTATTQPQLLQNVTRFEQQPLTNKFKKTEFNMTISPNNVQPLINDWVQPLTIDGRSGFYFELLPNEVLGWNIQFDFI